MCWPIFPFIDHNVYMEKLVLSFPCPQCFLCVQLQVDGRLDAWKQQCNISAKQAITCGMRYVYAAPNYNNFPDRYRHFVSKV